MDETMLISTELVDAVSDEDYPEVYDDEGENKDQIDWVSDP